MARKRVLSYRTTANLALAGGVVSLGAILAIWLMARAGIDRPLAAQLLGAAGIIMWFLGSAAGVLALSTPFKRRGAVGLGLCLAAMIALLVNSYLASGG